MGIIHYGFSQTNHEVYCEWYVVQLNHSGEEETKVDVSLIRGMGEGMLEIPQ